MTPDRQCHISHARRLDKLEAKIAALQRKLAVIEDTAAMEPHFPRALHSITEATAIEYRVTVSQLRGTSRKGKYIPARFMAYLRCHRAGFSYPVIGAYFGRDHTTIMHGAKQAAAKSEAPPG